MNTMRRSNVGFSLIVPSLAPKEDVSGQRVLYHTADESWGQGWLRCWDGTKQERSCRQLFLIAVALYY